MLKKIIAPKTKQLFLSAIAVSCIAFPVLSQAQEMRPGTLSRDILFPFVQPSNEFFRKYKLILEDRSEFDSWGYLGQLEFPGFLSIPAEKKEASGALFGMKRTLQSLFTNHPWLSEVQEFSDFVNQCPDEFDVVEIPAQDRINLFALLNAGYHSLNIEQKKIFPNSIQVMIRVPGLDIVTDASTRQYFANLMNWASGTDALSLGYRNFLFEQLGELTKIGTKLPLTAAGWKILNRTRLFREFGLYDINSVSVQNTLVASVPDNFLSNPQLQLKVKPGKLVLKREVDQGIRTFTLRHPQFQPDSLPSVERARYPLNPRYLPEFRNQYKGIEQTSEWVYGEFDDVVTEGGRHGNALSSTFNLMKAFPSASFLVHYTPEQWEKMYDVPNFKRYFREQAEKYNLSNSVRFIERGGSTDPNEFGYIWSRDSMIQGPNKKVYISNTDSGEGYKFTPQTQVVKTPFYLEGGGIFPVGKRTFMSRGVFERNLDLLKNFFKADITFTYEGTPYSENAAVKIQSFEDICQDLAEWSELNPWMKTQYGATVARGYGTKLFPEIFNDFEQWEKQEEIAGIIAPAIINKLDSGSYQCGYEGNNGEIGDKASVVQTVKNRFSEYFGRELVVVGEGLTTEPPHDHIDVYTIYIPSTNSGDKPTVLVGSVKLAYDMIAALSEQDVKRIEKKIGRLTRYALRSTVDNTVQLNGEVKGTKGIAVSPSNDPWIGSVRKSLTPQTLEESPNTLEFYEPRFNAEAAWYESQGYVVKRIPYLIQGRDNRFVYSTFNYSNGFMEVSKNDVSFTMARYGLTPLENYMRDLLNGLGVHVKFVDGMYLARGDAGPHCLTNENRKAEWWR